MRTIVELDMKDIREAIAEKYDCFADQVSIHTKEKTVGCGWGEHTVHEVYANIDKGRTTNGEKTINGTGENILSGIRVTGPTVGKSHHAAIEPAWSHTHSTQEVFDGITGTSAEYPSTFTD